MIDVVKLPARLNNTPANALALKNENPAGHREGARRLPHARCRNLVRRLAEGCERHRARVPARRRTAGHGDQCRWALVQALERVSARRSAATSDRRGDAARKRAVALSCCCPRSTSAIRTSEATWRASCRLGRAAL